ncbi:unnamed protein product [Cladocopium goreaui]|uniref:Pentacotripeptide-repeat region of PRORP domain-containing protein n=1 Tax=Cladocopium goreaui TaxID=2562237 RepID=A0A9P1BMT9_9DINO|nr:unnamed protein product [Cladocopium goreaui]
MCRRMTLRTAGRVAAQESAQSLTRQFSVAASARAFLLEMQQARVACNVLHYNASIIACHRSSEWENALDFFVEMQQRNLQQDQALSWRALCLFSNMCRRRIQADSTCSSAVRACDLGSKWTSALKFLQHMMDDESSRSRGSCWQKSEMDDFTEQLKEAVNRSAPVEDSDFGARETA